MAPPPHRLSYGGPTLATSRSLPAPVIEDNFFDLIDPILRGLGAVRDDGEEFRDPPLDVLRYDVRPVRLHRVPFLGRALSVVATVRQPIDVSLATGGYPTLLRRLAMAVNGRYPPWSRGLAVGLTTIVLTPEPIGPSDDAALQAALTALPRWRSVPLGLIRVNLGQEALSFALTSGPPGLFPEPTALADALTSHLRRFVNPLDAA